MRVLTLNVCGIRASERKGLFKWLKRQKSDFICLQEVRAQEDQIDDKRFELSGYRRYLSIAEKKGYSGVGIYANRKPLNIYTGIGDNFFDQEGRFLELEYKNYCITSVYFPSGSSSDERQKQKYVFMDIFEKYIERVKKRRKTTIICGDWNIAHKKIDIKNWRGNQKNSGFLPRERDWLTKMINDHNLIDCFRQINTKEEQYTWWSNRGKAWDNNVGWRIDYQMMYTLDYINILKTNIYKNKRFSDHSPLIIDYDF